MPSAFGSVDPRAVSGAVSALFGPDPRTRMAIDRGVLNEELLRERIGKARAENDAAARARAAFEPAQVVERTSLDTGITPGLIREEAEAARSGFRPEGPGLTEEMAARVRAALRRNVDPLAATHPERVASAQETARRGDTTSQLVRDALAGTTTRDRLNTAVGANVGRPHSPYTVRDHQVLNEDTGGLGATTDIGMSVGGLNLARGQTEQARQDELRARAGYRSAQTSERQARARVWGDTDPNRPRGSGGRGGNPEETRRKMQADAERAAQQRGLTGASRDEFVRDYMTDQGVEPSAMRPREPLTGAAAPSSVVSQFQADPQFKGKRLGAYERGKGYAVYDGRKLVGHVK